MRMIDADALMEDICESLNQMTNIGVSVDGEWLWGKLNDAIEHAPTIEPERKTGKWTTKEVAELLFNLFGEDCACNFNGIDEWLPERCKYVESTCPDPEEKHGCWMQFLLQGGADMREQP